MASTQQIDYLKQVISNLQNIVDGKEVSKINFQPTQKSTSSAQPSYPDMTEFDTLLLEFSTLGQSFSQSEIKEITEVSLNSLRDMQRVMEFSYRAKKPNQNQLVEIQKAITGKLKEIQKYDINKDFKIHYKSVTEAVNAIFWIFNNQMPKANIEMAIEASEFNALKLKQQKIPEQTKWYTALINAVKGLKPYVLQNFPTGLTYNAQGIDDYSELIDAINNNTQLVGGSKGGAAKQQQVQQPVQQVQQEEYPSIDEYLQFLKEFEEKSKAIGKPEIQQITDAALSVLRDQFKLILKNSYKLKKPKQNNIKDISEKIIANVKKVQDLKNKPDWKIHASPILNGLNIVFWVLNDMPKMIIDSAIESAEYDALKLKQKKVQVETEWYMSFFKALKFLQTYSKENFPTGLSWNNKDGSDDFSGLLGELSGQPEAPKPPSIPGPPAPGGPGGPPSLATLGLPKDPGFLPVKKQADAGADKGALFSQINVGIDGIKAHLRKTNKQQLKEEIQNRKLPSDKPQPVKQAPVKQQQQVVKEPKRYLKPQSGLYIENYVDTPLIEVNQEDENIEAKHCVFLDELKKTGVKVVPKINTIILNKCQKVQLQFNQVVSSVQLVNCKNVTIWCQERCPSIQIDKSEQVHISLMKDKDCEVLSSNTQEINLTYPETEEEMAKDTPVPEQFITKWDESQKKFVTKIFEQDI